MKNQNIVAALQLRFWFENISQLYFATDIMQFKQFTTAVQLRH